MNKTKKKKFTIQDLINHLKNFDLSSELIFADNQLTFYRAKGRGENLVQIEFNESIEGAVDIPQEK